MFVFLIRTSQSHSGSLSVCLLKTCQSNFLKCQTEHWEFLLTEVFIQWWGNNAGFVLIKTSQTIVLVVTGLTDWLTGLTTSSWWSTLAPCLRSWDTMSTWPSDAAFWSAVWPLWKLNCNHCSLLQTMRRGFCLVMLQASPEEATILLLEIKTYKVLDADIAAPEDESGHRVVVSGLGSLVESSLAVLEEQNTHFVTRSQHWGHPGRLYSQNINIEELVIYQDQHQHHTQPANSHNSQPLITPINWIKRTKTPGWPLRKLHFTCWSYLLLSGRAFIF